MQPKNNILHFGRQNKQQRSKDSGNYSVTEREESDSMTAEGPLGNLIKQHKINKKELKNCQYVDIL